MAGSTSIGTMRVLIWCNEPEYNDEIIRKTCRNVERLGRNFYVDAITVTYEAKVLQELRKTFNGRDTPYAITAASLAVAGIKGSYIVTDPGVRYG